MKTKYELNEIGSWLCSFPIYGDVVICSLQLYQLIDWWINKQNNMKKFKNEKRKISLNKINFKNGKHRESEFYILINIKIQNMNVIHVI